MEKLVNRAKAHASAVAINSPDGQYTYQQILDRSARIAEILLGSRDDLEEDHIAFAAPSGFEYVSVQWGIWRAGGVAVPLSHSATSPELEYALKDTDSGVVIDLKQGPILRALADGLKIKYLSFEEIEHTDVEDTEALKLPSIASDRRAMILFTSGTTSKPKGVVSTHANLEAQITTLIDAWKWNSTDSIPLFLPLHHIHGIVNVMLCALWAGATIEPFEKFDCKSIFDRVSSDAYSVFMAVPTIYVKMIQEMESLTPAELKPIADGFRKMRLMVSGSASLPATVHQRWQELTGQNLLERYGMTEIGMGLSNPYDGQRKPGMVGMPLPSVEIRLVNEEGEPTTDVSQSGEMQVRGPSVFLEYWNRPDVTKTSFSNGWFRTGDIAIIEDGYFRILGRNSVDIIKSGGYKLSALEIESALLDHPAILECAVVGIEDETWGEAVAAATVLNSQTNLDLASLREWCESRLSKYKIPKHLLTLNELPRNAMGKVTKPAVRALF